jgi:hypothetical protein
MNPNTPLLVTDKGSIILRGGRIAKPGEHITPADFKGCEAQLRILLDAGNLSEKDIEVTGLDIQRVDELPPPVPGDIDLKTGKGVLRGAPGGDEAATIARLKEIKQAQEAADAKTAARQKLLAEVGDSELTLEEAQALGVVHP